MPPVCDSMSENQYVGLEPQPTEVACKRVRDETRGMNQASKCSLQAQRSEETPTYGAPCAWMGWVTCAARWVVEF